MSAGLRPGDIIEDRCVRLLQRSDKEPVRIEQLCTENVIFMALAANSVPHFTTIADFRYDTETKTYIQVAVQRILPDLVCRELDQVRVKGRAGSVRIYQPMGIEGTVGLSVQNELVLWRQALTQYRAQEWGKAEAILKRLTASTPNCRLYSLYLERLVTLRVRQRVSSWDGVWQFDTS